jgi:hypothetical protein
MKEERIKFFAQLFYSVYGLLFDQEADDLEKLVVKSLLNIIFYISNYEEYRKELSSHKPLCILIKSLAKQPKQDVAKRICYNLKLSDASKSPSNKSKKEKSPKIYISYNWDNEDFCAEFINYLRKYTKVPIWVDYEQMDESEDPWEHLPSAIESATVIIVLISSAYIESKYNRPELSYATTKIKSSDEEKCFIFVEAEADFHFNGDWMENLPGEKKTILYNDNIDELARDVANQGPLSKNRKYALVSCSSGIHPQSRVCTVM